MKSLPIEISSVSWIDQKSVPKVGFWIVAGALTSWPKRVIMGLVGTSNPEPPTRLDSVAAWASSRQYRALLACSVEPDLGKKISNLVIDPGYTPPFDKSKLDTSLRSVAPIPDDPDFYPGEKSPLSGVRSGGLHACSTLALKRNSQVIVSAFIKFRAGQHTNKVGIEKANSPVHVPWVWCEFALVLTGSEYRLIGNGSAFPSHAWYVNGKQVAKRLQDQISTSEHDATLTTGQPASQAQLLAIADKSAGPANTHQYSIGGGRQFEVPVLMRR